MSVIFILAGRKFYRKCSEAEKPPWAKKERASVCVCECSNPQMGKCSSDEYELQYQNELLYSIELKHDVIRLVRHEIIECICCEERERETSKHEFRYLFVYLMRVLCSINDTRTKQWKPIEMYQYSWCACNITHTHTAIDSHLESRMQTEQQFWHAICIMCVMCVYAIADPLWCGECLSWVLLLWSLTSFCCRRSASAQTKCCSK